MDRIVVLESRICGFKFCWVIFELEELLVFLSFGLFFISREGGGFFGRVIGE